MSRSAPKTVHKLAMAEQYKLLQFTETNYGPANLNDSDFAALAESKLGFKITGYNVAGVRRALGIESTLDRLARERAEARAAATPAKESGSRLDKLEARIVALEAFVKELTGA